MNRKYAWVLAHYAYFLLMMSGAHSYEIKDEPLAALTAKQALL